MLRSAKNEWEQIKEKFIEKVQSLIMASRISLKKDSSAFNDDFFLPLSHFQWDENRISCNFDSIKDQNLSQDFCLVIEIFFHRKTLCFMVEKWTFYFKSSNEPDKSDNKKFRRTLVIKKLSTFLRTILSYTRILPMFTLYKNSGFDYIIKSRINIQNPGTSSQIESPNPEQIPQCKMKMFKLACDAYCEKIMLNVKYMSRYDIFQYEELQKLPIQTEKKNQDNQSSHQHNSLSVFQLNPSSCNTTPGEDIFNRLNNLEDKSSSSISSFNDPCNDIDKKEEANKIEAIDTELILAQKENRELNFVQMKVSNMKKLILTTIGSEEDKWKNDSVSSFEDYNGHDDTINDSDCDDQLEIADSSNLLLVKLTEFKDDQKSHVKESQSHKQKLKNVCSEFFLKYITLKNEIKKNSQIWFNIIKVRENAFINQKDNHK